MLIIMSLIGVSDINIIFHQTEQTILPITCVHQIYLTLASLKNVMCGCLVIKKEP